jgi:hypothetical protein
VHHVRSVSLILLAGAVLGVVACGDDPVIPSEPFEFAGCPAGRIAVDAPISLSFNNPAAVNTVVPGNVVVSNAVTGLELPGTLSLSSDGRTIVYTPSANLPFDTRVRIRIQNLLSANTTTPSELVVCEVLTALPPITQLWWDALPTVGAGRLLGGSMFEPDSGFIASNTVPIFRRTEDGWRVVFNEPYLNSSFDVQFPTLAHGFASHLDARVFVGVITESRDAGITFDSIYAQPGEVFQKLYVRRRTATDVDYFGAAMGGSAIQARMLKWRPTVGGGAFTSVATFGTTGQGADIDFMQSDTARGVAVSNGVRFANGLVFPGRVFVTSNGGNAWSEVANAVANDRGVTYLGAAIRSNGDLYVTGGSGYVLRLTPSGAGYTVTRILENRITNPDSTNFQALQYTDVQFAPDDQNIGWIVGAQLISQTGEAPRFQGVIFETRDGGQTWTRQGVRGADAFGADFPRLNRIVVLSATSVWLLGDGGLVLSYNP